MSDNRGEQFESGEVVTEAYEPPTLTHVGNLHDILAEASVSALCDNGNFTGQGTGHDAC
jgi:hypothetical protein